ncbi:hypothetical protein HK097_002566 [Rhizophlyctis rosea]|uniref:Dienelactone hydrolase domain-containing protein n=1 Tax=Rhizophlyctis rosea TaxID=64517 RepID=A0AAD5X6I4_9FUNG|nr:hypothetical protein HK097_002566 [Rhizophlyctis rosea]
MSGLKEGDHNHTCCSLPPFNSEYVPKGHVQTLGDLPVYFAGEKGKKAVIVIPDIFGLHKLTQQFADALAFQGFYIALLDSFRGNPWSKAPLILDELKAFLSANVPYDPVMKSDVLSVISHLHSQGVESIAALGFCWGGLITTQLGSDEEVVQKGLKAVSSVHPSFHTLETVKGLKVPVAYLPSQNESDFKPLLDSLSHLPFASKNVHVRFDDVHHGFAAARANYDDPVNVKRSGEAVQVLKAFYESVL